MVSRFAPVAPLKVHQAMADAGVLGTYHLLLAHQVLAKPEEHSDFYRMFHLMPRNPGHKGGYKRNGQPYIIMDNSLIELGKPLPVDHVVEAARVVGAKVIVLPDKLGNRIETLEMAAQAMETLKQLRLTEDYARAVKVLGVAQGESHNDVFSCARDMIQILGVDMISVPRHVTGRIGSRIEVTRAIAKYGKPIHLLGFSNNLFDDFYTVASVPGVMGIDSALPVWYGLQGFTFPSDPPVVADFGRRPDDYEQQTDINQQVIQNMKRVNRWATVNAVRTGK